MNKQTSARVSSLFEPHNNIELLSTHENRSTVCVVLCKLLTALCFVCYANLIGFSLFSFCIYSVQCFLCSVCVYVGYVSTYISAICSVILGPSRPHGNRAFIATCACVHVVTVLVLVVKAIAVALMLFHIHFENDTHRIFTCQHSIQPLIARESERKNGLNRRTDILSAIRLSWISCYTTCIKCCCACHCKTTPHAPFFPFPFPTPFSCFIKQRYIASVCVCVF